MWRRTSLNGIEAVYDSVEEYIDTVLRPHNEKNLCARSHFKAVRISNDAVKVPVYGVEHWPRKIILRGVLSIEKDLEGVRWFVFKRENV